MQCVIQFRSCKKGKKARQAERKEEAQGPDMVRNDRLQDPRAPASPYCRRPICTFVRPPSFSKEIQVDSQTPPIQGIELRQMRIFPSIRIRAVGSLQMPRILKSTDAVKLHRKPILPTPAYPKKPSHIKLHRKIRAPDDRYLCTSVFTPATCWRDSRRCVDRRSWKENRSQLKGTQRGRYDRRHRWGHPG